jgi:hypothetical protein
VIQLPSFTLDLSNDTKRVMMYLRRKYTSRANKRLEIREDIALGQTVWKRLRGSRNLFGHLMVADYADGVENRSKIDDEEWRFVEIGVNFEEDLVWSPPGLRILVDDTVDKQGEGVLCVPICRRLSPSPMTSSRAFIWPHIKDGGS